MRNESGNVIQSSQETYDFLLNMGSLHIFNGFNLGGVNFNTFTTNDETYEFTGSYPKGTLVWIQSQLVLL